MWVGNYLDFGSNFLHNVIPPLLKTAHQRWMFIEHVKYDSKSL